MQEGIDRLDTAELATRADRAGCCAFAAALPAGLAVVVGLNSNGSASTMGAILFYVGMPVMLMALAAVAYARGAASRLRRGDPAGAAEGLGCAARLLMVPAILLAIPGFGTLIVGLVLLSESAYQSHAGDRNAGCAAFIGMLYLVFGVPGSLYVVCAFTAAGMARRVLSRLP